MRKEPPGAERWHPGRDPIVEDTAPSGTEGAGRPPQPGRRAGGAGNHSGNGPARPDHPDGRRSDPPGAGPAGREGRG